MTTRILLVYDVDGWAWHKRAMALKKYAPPQYEVDIRGGYDMNRAGEYDAVFCFSWTVPRQEQIDSCRRCVALSTCHGLEWRHALPDNIPSRAATKRRNKARGREKLKMFDAVIAVNQALYEQTSKHAKHAVLIPSGIDLQFWHPQERRTNKKMVVGWCGNILGPSVKGCTEILEPLIGQYFGSNPRIPSKKMTVFETEYWRFEVNTNNHETAVTSETMRDWYNGLDVFLCTSACEGTPSPVFEAAACGVPVISTDVGMVKDWPEVAFKVPAYVTQRDANISKDWMIASLTQLRLMSDRERAAMGMEQRDSLAGWCDYETVAPKMLEAIAG